MSIDVQILMSSDSVPTSNSFHMRKTIIQKQSDEMVPSHRDSKRSVPLPKRDV